MPYLGNLSVSLYPSQLQTTSFRSDTGDGSITLADIVNGPSTTDSGIKLSSGGVDSALFTEVDGNILSYGINVQQINTSYDSLRAGGIFRLDVRTDLESPSLLDAHCFVVKGRSEGETTEFDALGIDFNTGNTYLSLDKGNVGIGTTNPQYKLHVNGTINITDGFYVNGTLVNLSSIDYGLITGAVDSSTDYGSLS